MLLTGKFAVRAASNSASLGHSRGQCGGDYLTSTWCRFNSPDLVSCSSLRSAWMIAGDDLPPPAVKLAAQHCSVYAS